MLELQPVCQLQYSSDAKSFSIRFNAHHPVFISGFIDYFYTKLSVAVALRFCTIVLQTVLFNAHCSIASCSGSRRMYRGEQIVPGK